MSLDSESTKGLLGKNKLYFVLFWAECHFELPVILNWSHFRWVSMCSWGSFILPDFECCYGMIFSFTVKKTGKINFIWFVLPFLEPEYDIIVCDVRNDTECHIVFEEELPVEFWVSPITVYIWLFTVDNYSGNSHSIQSKKK